MSTKVNSAETGQCLRWENLLSAVVTLAGPEPTIKDSAVNTCAPHDRFVQQRAALSAE